MAPPQDEVSPGKRPCVEVPPQDVPQIQVVSTAGEVTKGDLQKADNASVPDHLWLRAFVVGYGDEACAVRHREALTLPTGFVGALGASPEVLACQHDTGLHHLVKGERAPSSGRWGPDGSVPMASSHVPSVRMDRQGKEALPGGMADPPGQPRREGHGRGELRCHTLVRRCNMVRMAQGLSPPLLELRGGIPASGTGRAATLHDRFPQRAVYAEAGQGQGLSQARVNEG